MSTPLFKKGEDVLLRSTTHPQFDGEYTVQAVGVCTDSDVVMLDGDGKGLLKGRFKTLPDGFVYDLGNFLNVPKGRTLNHETELRKKHKPAELSFESLLTSLKSDKVEEVK